MSNLRPNRLVGLVAGVLFAGHLAAQETVVRYDFEDGNSPLVSTDSSNSSTAGDLATGGASFYHSIYGNPGRSFYFGSGWYETSETSPASSTQEYLTFTVTPQSGSALNFTSLELDLQAELASRITSLSVYADENPGPGGDNFSTRIGTCLDVATSNTAQWYAESVNLRGASFLQGVTQPVTFRVYVWRNGSVSSAQASRIDNLTVGANVSRTGGRGRLYDLAKYDFESYRYPYKSVDDSPCSRAGQIDPKRYVTIIDEAGSKVLKMDTNWRPADQNDTEYWRNEFSITITPNTAQNALVSLEDVCMSAWRTDCSMLRYVDVRVDEDPGPGGNNFQDVVATMVFPPTTSQAQYDTICVNLAGVPFLQNVRTEITIHLHLYGHPAASCLDFFCVDNFLVTGRCFQCPPASVTDLGPGCVRDDVQVHASLPLLGDDMTFSMDTNYPNAPVYFLFSFGTANPPLPFPGTDCSVYIDLALGLFFPAGATDGNGDWSLMLPIPNDPMIPGLELTFQTFVWLATGDRFSNGLLGRVGCL